MTEQYTRAIKHENMSLEYVLNKKISENIILRVMSIVIATLK